jgi:hypothetical protein
MDFLSDENVPVPATERLGAVYGKVMISTLDGYCFER